MVRLEGGPFLMGSESPDVLPLDGEGPVRLVTLDPFFISKYAVTNAEFAEFVKATGYRTEAERLGWSFVFQNYVQGKGPRMSPAQTPWWIRVEGTNWAHPKGPHSSHRKRPYHPAVHISWNDATAYCEWAGVRLATEAEWEFACRGGLQQATYPWGDELNPGGRHMCNIWQGTFPTLDLGEDGYSGTAPVYTFDANAFGLSNTVGNVWEWCSDYFHPSWHQTGTLVNPTGPASGSAKVLRGGSYLCHRSFCFRYRNSARHFNTPDSSTGNLGFRVARD